MANSDKAVTFQIPDATTSSPPDSPSWLPAPPPAVRAISPVSSLAQAPPPSPLPHPGTVRTRLLLLSDTHAHLPAPPTANRSFRRPLPAADVLLHAGDLTWRGKLKEHEAALTLLESASAPVKLVVAGNHDITLDADYYPCAVRRGRWALEGGPHQLRGGNRADVAAARDAVAAARALWTGARARRAGVRLLDEGPHDVALPNGARLRVYASPYTPEFSDWGFGYGRLEDRFNADRGAAQPVPEWPAVDVLMTHGPPQGILSKVAGSHEDVGCAALARAVRRARPRLHVFGHIHEEWGAERVDWKAGTARRVEGGEEDGEGKRECASFDGTTGREGGREGEGEGEGPLRWGEETLFVNAAIMTVNCNPLNAPWVVDLDLPAAGGLGAPSSMLL